MELTIRIDPRMREEIEAAIETLAHLHPDRLAPPAESAIRAVDEVGEDTPESPASSPPDDDRGSEVPTPRLVSTPAAGPPASKVDAVAAEVKRQKRQGGAKGRAGVTRGRILDFIREHPGCGVQAIQDETGIGKGGISTHLSKLSKSGQIHIAKKGKRNAYTAAADGDQGMLKTDQNGAKSEQERKLVAALLEAACPLPASELSIRAGIRSDHCPAMCEGLVRRRVITRIAPNAAHLPTRYQAIKRTKTMSDRVAA